jgi:predicted ATP-grasp superfamily ATP-dependent carboligase
MVPPRWGLLSRVGVSVIAEGGRCNEGSAVDKGADVLIIGASVRACACSALRAGLRPWCVDLFADADLRGRCPARRLPGRYPHGFLEELDRGPPGPWMYTGGLENQPRLIGQLAERRPLWGNGPEVLAKVRDPFFLARVCRGAEIPTPVVKRPAGRPPQRGSWLVKPLRGAGGSGIRFCSAAEESPPGAGVYLQQYIEGQPAAALYLGTGRSAHLLGVLAQLVGESWLHAAPFAYCGSIGLLPLGPWWRPEVERLGMALAAASGLSGVFGVDGVVRDDHFWPVEVNPRYTASVEVLEYATGLAVLGGPVPALPVPAACVSKAVLFAPRDLVFPADGPWLEVLRRPLPVEEMPAFADIPHPGERISAGRPVLTFFARADTPASCADILRQRARDLDRLLFGA